MKKVFAIIMSAMMLVCFMPAMAFADGEASAKNWDKNGKFMVGLQSGATTATAEVYDDYSVLAKVSGNTVDAAALTVSAKMKNVESLGVTGERSYSKTFETGLNKGSQIPLPTWFPHIFGDNNTSAFGGATITGQVDGNDFGYTVSGFTKKGETPEYELTATPTDIEKVRTAWHALTANVSTDVIGDNSKIEIPTGAYLQVGKEKLEFKSKCLVDPSSQNNGAGTVQAIKDAAELNTKAENAKENVELYVPKDSVIQLSSSLAKLNRGIYIRSDIQLPENTLASLRTAANTGLAETVVSLINVVDGTVALASPDADGKTKTIKVDVLSAYSVTVDDTKTKTETMYAYNDTFTLPNAGAGYKWVDANKNTVNAGTITVTGDMVLTKESTGSAGVGGGGRFYVPTVQKPEITIIGSGKADLSADGRTATITANAGHELVSVVLNGKEMGKVEKLTGLKTGDKATITFQAKTDGKAEMDKMIAQKASKLTLMARSAKTAKKNIKVVVKGDLKAITDAGYTVKYKFYRSTKKSAGYKAMLTKKAPTYFNTYGKKGTMYYYKARVMIYDKDGNFVAQTALKQCKYANRLWTK